MNPWSVPLVVPVEDVSDRFYERYGQANSNHERAALHGPAPKRFGDLCLALIYPLHPWVDLRRYGRTGSRRLTRSPGDGS